MADARMKRLLSSPLADAGISPLLARKLGAHDIRTVYDLVRLPERIVSRLSGLTLDASLRIADRLSRHGLRLGMDVQLNDDTGEYYISQ